MRPGKKRLRLLARRFPQLRTTFRHGQGKLGSFAAPVLEFQEESLHQEVWQHREELLLRRFGRVFGPRVHVESYTYTSVRHRPRCGRRHSDRFTRERAFRARVGCLYWSITRRAGRFELAHRGTIFLDEIGEIPLELQPKLLRVLQEREFERLGSTRTLRFDARLIAATNCDLKAMVDEHKFPSDLYYRLNVFPIRLPPLRERAEDIPLLVRHFVQQFSERNNQTIDTIRSETIEALTRYHWPGNIRGLQNVIERAVIITKGATLTVALDELKPDAGLKTSPSCGTLQPFLAEMERTQILRALEESNWVVAGPNGAAARLGIKRTTLQARMQKLGIHLLRRPIPESRTLPSVISRRDGRVLEWPVRNPPRPDGEREAWRPALASARCS